MNYFVWGAIIFVLGICSGFAMSFGTERAAKADEQPTPPRKWRSF